MRRCTRLVSLIFVLLFLFSAFAGARISDNLDDLTLSTASSALQVVPDFSTPMGRASP